MEVGFPPLSLRLLCLQAAAQRTMTPAELANYEALKTKLRTAMADPTLVDELEKVSTQ